MQGDDAGLRVAAGNFDCGGMDQLVQRRLGRAVAIPATQCVIADGADAGRKGGEMRRAVAGDQAQRVFEDKGRANGIERELGGKGVGIQRAQGFFGANTINFQRAGGG